jgi:hypothetical protein
MLAEDSRSASIRRRTSRPLGTEPEDHAGDERVLGRSCAAAGGRDQLTGSAGRPGGQSTVVECGEFVAAGVVAGGDEAGAAFSGSGRLRIPGSPSTPTTCQRSSARATQPCAGRNQLRRLARPSAGLAAQVILDADAAQYPERLQLIRPIAEQVTAWPPLCQMRSVPARQNLH